MTKISFYWTQHISLTGALPRAKKIYMWKKADVPSIKKHLNDFSNTFCTPTNQSVEQMWTSFKSAITVAVDKFVSSKMSSTRQTHPWVDTKLRRLLRKKQRAHWRAKKSKKDKDWQRYKRLQRSTQQSSRMAEKSYMQDVVSEDMKTNPKRFFTYVKSRKQEAEGVSALMN